MKNQADYSQYECPYAHLEKDCGHELKGPEGYENTYGVWCACGFRGPVFYIDPEELGLKKKVTSKPCDSAVSEATGQVNQTLGDPNHPHRERYTCCYPRPRGETMKDRKELAELRNAIADYMWSEGCTCCRDIEAHDQAKERLAKLLRVPKYKDGSDYDFSKFRTKKS